MATGVIRHTTDKMYGFIKPDDGGKEIFFHRSGLRQCVWEDMKVGLIVTFDTVDSPKGPRAENVRIAV